MPNTFGYGNAAYGVGPYGGDPVLAYDIGYYVNLITSEYQSKSPNFIKWASALLQKLTDLSDLAQTIPDAYDMDLAIGAQLDVLGLLLGTSRQLPFTPTEDSAAVNQLVTVFNEASVGANLAGTAPALNVAGHSWLLWPTISTSWLYQAGGGIASSANAIADAIDTGLDDAIVKWTGVINQATQLFAFRAPSPFGPVDNYLAVWTTGSGGIELREISAGTWTTLDSAAVADGTTGDITVSFKGNQLNVTAFGQLMSATIASGHSTLTGSVVGMFNAGAAGGIVHSLTVTTQPTTTPISSILDDDDFRTLMKARIAFNNWNGQIDSLQPIWQSIFPGGTIVVDDAQNETVSLIIAGAFSNLTKQMIANGLIVPRPYAVLYNFVFSSLPVLGFDADTEFIAGLDKGHFA